MTDKNANTEIHKEFCPNCEAETPCTHEAELYVCDICGEDFAKYIVSRNCNVSDVSTTQDVTTPEPPEDALNARIAELEEENDRLQSGWFRDETICPDGSLSPKVSDLLNRIAELSQAVGLITTLKPTMVMDANHPLDMVREVAEHVTARIAKLEAEIDQLTAHDATERQDDKWIPVSERLPDNWESVLTIDISKSTQDEVQESEATSCKFCGSNKSDRRMNSIVCSSCGRKIGNVAPPEVE